MPKVSREHLDRRRQQILEAATECFARQGFHGTSMQDIFDASGLRGPAHVAAVGDRRRSRPPSGTGVHRATTMLARSPARDIRQVADV